MRTLTVATEPVIDTVLIHGLYNTGKTTLLGSALQYEKQYGRCAYLLIGGEPGFNTVRQFDLEGVELLGIDTLGDIDTLVKEAKDNRFRCLCVDSLSMLNDLAEDVETKGMRAPGSVKAGEGIDGQAEWGRIKFNLTSRIEALKKVCDLFIAVCPSKIREENVVSKKGIATDLVGELGTKIAHRFAFVGYLEAVPLNATVAQRQLSFHMRVDALTRCNAKKPMTKPITLKDPVSIWPTVKTALDTCLKG